MDHVPDAVLMNVLTYLPDQSYLPTCHVSSRFRLVWIQTKRQQLSNGNGSGHTSGHGSGNDNEWIYQTKPLAIGNLFNSSWLSSLSSSSSSSSTKNVLNKKLLTYYINNGYGSSNPIHDDDDTSNTNTNNNSGNGKNKNPLKKVMLETAARGDISGMHYMGIIQRYYKLDNDPDICTMASAAGQLKALKWLRGDYDYDYDCSDGDGDGDGNSVSVDEKNAGHGHGHNAKIKCPWDPTEVHREAAENLHDDIMDYVEKNSESHEIQMSYGVGLPW